MNGDGSILIALAALCLSAIATALPQVEDPWPETIGLDFPFTVAGAASVASLSAAVLLDRSEKSRDRWTRNGLAGGFIGGAAVYLLALAAQVLSIEL